MFFEKPVSENFRKNERERSPPELADVNEFAFDERLNTFGYPDTRAFTLIDFVRSDAISYRPSSKRGYRANNARYAVCSRLGLPLITVRISRKYSQT